MASSREHRAVIAVLTWKPGSLGAGLRGSVRRAEAQRIRRVNRSRGKEEIAHRSPALGALLEEPEQGSTELAYLGTGTFERLVDLDAFPNDRYGNGGGHPH